MENPVYAHITYESEKNASQSANAFRGDRLYNTAKQIDEMPNEWPTMRSRFLRSIIIQLQTLTSFLLCEVIFFYWWLSQVILSFVQTKIHNVYMNIYIATNARKRTFMPQLSTWQLITFPVALHLSPYSNNEHHAVFEWIFFPHITVFCC